VGESWHFQLAAAGISRVRVAPPYRPLPYVVYYPYSLISDQTCCKYGKLLPLIRYIQKNMSSLLNPTD